MARGDHVFVENDWGGWLYEHHGIDMGDGTIIHLGPLDAPRIALKDSSQRFAVRRVSWHEFSAGRPIWTRRHPEQLDPETTVRTAESMLGCTGYSLLEGNCEHFATACATGQWVSRQVEVSASAVRCLGSAATKTLWATAVGVSARLGLRGAVKIHPAALLADGVEVVALAAGCRCGLSADHTQRLARTSGNIAAIGIGGLFGGPAGAAAGLALHAGSTVVAEGLCRRVRQWLA
ncbi:MAG: lecithin retinol acyltransferase family protein [Pirellulaceae bacterium]|nr:lecithin retinol acyltransferase family protein [Pirellulaceae bacterium]